MHKSYPNQLLEIIWRVAILNRDLPNNKTGIAYESVRLEAQLELFPDFDKCLTRLKNTGLITEKNPRPNSRRLFMTEKALAKMVEDCMTKSRSAAPSEDKGEELVILSFDIPEKSADRRRSLNALLKKLGYERTHKTTWTGSPTSLDHLRLLLKVLGYGPYVKIYTGYDVTSA